MKKLTLNQTWRKCLKMWKWIVEHLEEGDVSGLKRSYLRTFVSSDLMDWPNLNCYFCEYNERQGGKIADPDLGEVCEHCPGTLVSRRFHCERISYDYDDKPRAFYRKLLALDKKRKAKK